MMHNPFLQNPLWMLLHASLKPMDPFEGNGLLHPVYISPSMMHELEQSVPPWQSPSLINAQQGNLECDHGATVSCADSGKQTRTFSPQGVAQLKDTQIPRKISCFAGCAGQ